MPGKTEDGIRYLTKRDLLEVLTVSEWAQFKRWIEGQGCPLVDEQTAYYEQDVLKFLSMVREVKPNEEVETVAPSELPGTA